MEVKFKKLNSIAKTPTYAKYGDAGLDFTATRVISEDEYKITYGTDISIEIPYGYVGLLFPRSSIRKYDLTLTNCVGVIDAGYRGELMAVYNKNNGLASQKYGNGDKIFQLIIIPIPKINLVEVNELSVSSRGDGGFGHSGE